MIKSISKPVMSRVKSGAIASAVAFAVVSLQVNADVNNVAVSAGAPNALSASGQPWSPSAGFADLIERVSPAVVHVRTSGFVSSKRGNSLRQFNFPPGFGFEDMFPQFQNPEGDDPESKEEKQTQPLGIGSGFIISSDGFVVTNHHVIKNADEIIVTLTDGVEYEAEIQGSDPKTDVALLKLKDAKDLPIVEWGDDQKSRVGDWVLAIGNPFGLGGSASAGIISARGRNINSGPYDDFIQVDAAINRGNSGGPLFNTNGEVIGINAEIISPNGGSVGIGFSIPSNLAKSVINQLQTTGDVERAWIGVKIQPVDDDLAEGFGRKDKQGALISEVVTDAPADKAGMKAGDIILSYDGTQIKEVRDLPKTVAESSVGEKHKVVVWRNRAKKTITIITERFPEDPGVASNKGGSKNSDSKISIEESIDAVLSKLGTDERTSFGIDKSVSGVLVLSIESGGLADKNGLRQGDVISALNGVKVDSAKDVATVMKAAKKRKQSTINILLSRANETRFMPFRLK